MTDADIDGVLERSALAAAIARRSDSDDRARWCEAVAEGLESRADQLVAVAQAETHLPAARLASELRRTVFQLRFLAGEVRSGSVDEAVIDRADADWAMGPRPDIRRINVPIGVVGVFGASNFPFAFSVAGGDTASALAAGCSVVHKVHSGHEDLGRLTAAIARDALEHAGAPADLLIAVYGRAAGERLVTHPLTKAVGFTGSTRVGRMLFDLAAARPTPIPFYGELGSTNPVFVTEGAWAARSGSILTGFASSLMQGMGQFCTKPGYLIAPALGPSIEVLAGALASTPRHPLLTPALREHYLASVEEMRASGAVESVIVDEADPDVPAVIFRVDAAALLEDPQLLSHEMFGPAAVLVEADSDRDLVALAGVIEGQLTATMHAEPGDDVAELLDVLSDRCGRLVWNDWPTGVTVSFAQQHGGPYPAGTVPGATSVGAAAVRRFVRPVAFQGFPSSRLPERLRDSSM